MLHNHADKAGGVTPANDEASNRATGRGPQDQHSDDTDSPSAPHSRQALAVIEGEDYARAWLHRLHAGTAQPGELAVILAFLRDEMLHGACRVIEKAMGVRRG